MLLQLLQQEQVDGSVVVVRLSEQGLEENCKFSLEFRIALMMMSKEEN